MNEIRPNILLIGCGAHAKRVYLPALKATECAFGTLLKAVVELTGKESDTNAFLSNFYPSFRGIYIVPFHQQYSHSLPSSVEEQLDQIVKEQEINGVIIATDPLTHMQYALWAQKKSLHIFMDKPISTYENISNSIEQTKQLKTDFGLLMENYSAEKAFIVNVQRRFLPQFEIIQSKVNEIAKKYGIPITSMQSTHSDGQWRLPKEALEIKYHSHLGWGKVSHSGYHFIDMAGKIVKDSFKESGKKIDGLSVYAQFIRQQGILKQQSRKDMLRIFGQEYQQLVSQTDAELAHSYKIHNEAEVDATAIINLSHEGIPVTNITLNLMHNGFSRRAWMLPHKNLYKGNGRVRHEYHNIQQGPLQNIQIHSYQSKDNHDFNTESDFSVGGNNHYDIYIYKNVGIIGGPLIEIITAKDIADQYGLDKTKVMNELARHAAINEFIEVIIGKRKGNNTKANLADHALSVQLMSMIYEAGITKSNIIQSVNI